MEVQPIPEAFKANLTPNILERFVSSLAGSRLHNLDSLVKKQSYLKKPIQLDDLEAIKQKIVARESHGMIEFLPTKQALEDLDGDQMIAIKERIEGDLSLWKDGRTNGNGRPRNSARDNESR